MVECKTSCDIDCSARSRRSTLHDTGRTQTRLDLATETTLNLELEDAESSYE